jgi:Na+/H+ antiporter NhaD/arsenite permease-like protein
MDFVVNTGLIAWAGMLLALIFFYFSLRKTLTASQQNRAGASYTIYPEPKEAITNVSLFLLHTGIFVLAIVLLITHAQTGISVALIGVIAAVLTLLTANKDALLVVKKIDWRTLLFFIGLFICVGGLEETGVLKLLASFIGNISGGNLMVVVTIILWISAFASAVIDNIPFAATMVPVISQLGQTLGLNLHPIAWALALGTDIGGNGTPIGASANVVGTAISEREGYPVAWGRYLKYCMPSMILVIGLCNLLLFVKY